MLVGIYHRLLEWEGVKAGQKWMDGRTAQDCYPDTLGSALTLFLGVPQSQLLNNYPVLTHKAHILLHSSPHAHLTQESCLQASLFL